MLSNELSGLVRKLHIRAEHPASYQLVLQNHILSVGETSLSTASKTSSRVESSSVLKLNDCIGHLLSFTYHGEIRCVDCNKVTPKSYNQGYCYSCFQRLAQCDTCIMAPERCHYSQGTCREPVWGEHYCMQDHLVYLANSSGLKVGITRASQAPIRWLDQGATQALAIIRTRTRQQAGFCEALFRTYVTDRTNWRAMLQGGMEQKPLNMSAEAERLFTLVANELNDLRHHEGELDISILVGVESVEFSYPCKGYSDYNNENKKIPVVAPSLTVIDLEKEKTFSGELLGMKGQYLIFPEGVLNIRKYTGYSLTVSVN
jgi:hypothetical protein